MGCDNQASIRSSCRSLSNNRNHLRRTAISLQRYWRSRLEIDHRRLELEAQLLDQVITALLDRVPGRLPHGALSNRSLLVQQHVNNVIPTDFYSVWVSIPSFLAPTSAPLSSKNDTIASLPQSAAAQIGVVPSSTSPYQSTKCCIDWIPTNAPLPGASMSAPFSSRNSAIPRDPLAAASANSTCARITPSGCCCVSSMAFTLPQSFTIALPRQ